MKRVLRISAILIAFLTASVQVFAGDVATLYYRINSSKVEYSFGANGAFLKSLGSVIGGENALIRIKSVRVHATASPDGPLSFNRNLAAARAWSTVDVVRQRYSSLPDSVFVVSMTDEDWSGVASYLKRSDRVWKEDALKIVQSGRSDREDRLRELYVGEAWDDLAENCFPALRRAEISVEYIAGNLADTGGAECSQAESRVLSCLSAPLNAILCASNPLSPSCASCPPPQRCSRSLSPPLPSRSLTAFPPAITTARSGSAAGRA